MIRSVYLKCIYLLFLAGTVFAGGGFAATTNHFAGNWALKLGNRVLMAVVLKPAPGAAGRLTGWFATPKHFKVGGAGEFFSDIRGPVVREPIIQSHVTGNCVELTTQNPTEKKDTTNFRLCLGAPGHATLGIDFPAIMPWQVAKEKGPVVVSTDWDSSRTYFQGETSASNPEIRRIFEADQKDRQVGFGKIDWAVVNMRDAIRRKQVRQLLAEGRLHSGKDFSRAAFIFQHGGTADDYLLAHTLAMIAVARGEGSAIWIAAATLDRYLHSIHQPQIYGTQFFPKPDGQVTQEPYDRHLISDALRQDLGVPSQTEQKAQEGQYAKNKEK